METYLVVLAVAEEIGILGHERSAAVVSGAVEEGAAAAGDGGGRGGRADGAGELGDGSSDSRHDGGDVCVFVCVMGGKRCCGGMKFC